MKQRTLAIIKPDAVSRKLIAKILERIEQEGFRIVAMKLVHLTKTQAEGFYNVHRGKPFFEELVKFMSSGPCVLIILESKQAIKRWRTVIGGTDPKKAAPGTIRDLYGEKFVTKTGYPIQKNCVHGSDSTETAEFETGYFFDALEIVPDQS
jgi:nucleoside-diphosphate kinase